MATMIKTQNAQIVGAYKETSIDQQKKEVDFLIKDMGYIVWKDGRGQNVTSFQLSKLQAKHTCMADF